MKIIIFKQLMTLLIFCFLQSINTVNAETKTQKNYATTCPTANDLYYYFEPILNSSGVPTGFRVTVCKRIAYSNCPITVTLAVQGITPTGSNTTTNVAVVIPANANCGSVDVSAYFQIQCINYVSITCCPPSCLTPSDISYWVDAFDDGNGGILFYQLNTCKIPLFDNCDVTVYVTITGINGSGQFVTINTSVWISKTQSCGVKKFGHAWLEVLTVDITSVVCSNCTIGARKPGISNIESSGYPEIVPQISKGKFFVYPNPAKDEFIINYNSEKSQKIEIFITSADGKISNKKIETANKGVNMLKQNTNSYMSGIYFIRIYSESKLRHIQKLIISK